MCVTVEERRMILEAQRHPQDLVLIQNQQTFFFRLEDDDDVEPQGGGDRTVCISYLFVLGEFDLLGFMSLINILLHFHRYMFSLFHCYFTSVNICSKTSQCWVIFWLERKSYRKWRLETSQRRFSMLLRKHFCNRKSWLHSKFHKYN